MAMEKENFRSIYASLREMFPDKLTLKPHEVAKATGMGKDHVYTCIRRKVNPLPAKDVRSRGATKPNYIIPIAALANWLA